jgi:hypothetical protein
MVWGFCYLRIFKKMHSISGRSLGRGNSQVTALPFLYFLNGDSGFKKNIFQALYYIPK